MKKITLRVFLFAVLGLVICGTALLSKTASEKYISAPNTGVAQEPEPEVVYCVTKGDGVEKEPEPEVVYCVQKGDGVEKEPEPEVVYCAQGDGVENDPEPEVVYCILL